MSTDMFGCYQKFGPQQIRYYLIAVWVNIDVDLEGKNCNCVIHIETVCGMLSRVCFTFCVVYCVLNIISFVLCSR